MIHSYKFDGKNIILDVNSGSVHIFDDLAYEMVGFLKDEVPEKLPTEVLIKLLKVYSSNQIESAHKELLDLYKGGMLFSEDRYENVADNLGDAPIKSMCMNVAHDCNLCCEYCFASKGDFGCARSLMSYETGKRAIDFLLKNSEGRRNLEVDFFGGEPLMNFDVVKKIVKYARSLENKYDKNFRFTITTNGLLLDDSKIDFINQEMSNVVLSLDGRKEVNDRMRLTENKKGSFDVIVPKFKKLVDKRAGKDYYVRGTFTRYNLDFTKDVFSIYDLGFKNISIEPVVCEEDLEYSIREVDIPRIKHEYDVLTKKIIEKRKGNENFTFFHFMIDLGDGPCVIKRLRGCSCGNEYVAVTPEGDMYPCHQFVGKAEWVMGNVNEDIIDYEKKNLFSKINVYKKKKCRNCWAKFFCSGGCNANNWQYTGDLLEPYKISCELAKKRFECAIALKI